MLTVESSREPVVSRGKVTELDRYTSGGAPAARGRDPGADVGPGARQLRPNAGASGDARRRAAAVRPGGRGYRRALEVYEKASGEESREFVEGLFRLAGFYTRQERFGEAEGALRKLMAISEKEIGVAELKKADYVELYGHVLGRLGHAGEAEAALARANEIRAGEGQRGEVQSEGEGQPG